MPDEQCPICSNVLRENPRLHSRYAAKFYDCPQCGRYILGGMAKTDVENSGTSKQLISAWIRLQNKRGNHQFFITDDFKEEDWFKNLHNMGFPQTVNEKFNVLLKAYADIVGDNYNEEVHISQHPELVSDTAAKHLDEIIGLTRFLEDLGYVKAQITSSEIHVKLTANGWLRIDELSKSISSSDSAFIAMWFYSITNNYREAVKEAVTACGYKPVTIDDTEFNDFIMNEVITSIRQARFLIADLTCIPEDDDTSNSKVTGGVRGGVYWEAGMAYGMGKTVIQTCRKDDCSSRRIHFDLNQYKTILWEEDNLTTEPTELFNHVDNPSFAQKLAQHIMATVGKGSYVAVSE